jgi:hypothetical protein
LNGRVVALNGSLFIGLLWISNQSLKTGHSAKSEVLLAKEILSFAWVKDFQVTQRMLQYSIEVIDCQYSRDASKQD